jgi:hypothetical protein
LIDFKLKNSKAAIAALLKNHSARGRQGSITIYPEILVVGVDRWKLKGGNAFRFSTDY